MCGIVGVVLAKGNAAPFVLDGISKLEYRGYDSAGIATLHAGNLTVHKAIGRVSNLEPKGARAMEGSVGMAHTRWATHGGVTDANAHPHTDVAKRVAVVHNGVIENYAALRTELQKAGVTFRSQTDTEVIAHLVSHFLSNGDDLPAASRHAALRLQGSYGLLIASADAPHAMVALRHESPLVVGMGAAGSMAASDTLPLLGNATKVAYLDDGDMAVLSPNDIQFFAIADGKPLVKKLSKLTGSAQDAQLDGHAHFMLKEIYESPRALRAAVLQDPVAVQSFADGLKRAKRVIIVACGTARHAGLVGRFLMNKIGGTFAEVMIGSEFGYFAHECDKNTVVLAVSQSGETADVLNGVREAKKRGAKIYSIVNVVNSSLARTSDKVLYINAGPEIGVAATKSFTNQLAVFYLVAFALAGELNRGVAEMAQMSDLLQQAITDNDANAKTIAAKLAMHTSAYYLGRGIQFAMALEGALKLKETSYIHAEGMPAGELKHGALALIETDTPVIAINPADHTRDETLTNVMETKARGAWVIGVSDENHKAYDAWLSIPKVNPLYYPLLTAAPLQLLAYHAAIQLGRDPDKPRNLAKSVTVK